MPLAPVVIPKEKMPRTEFLEKTVDFGTGKPRR
jgi:hypothetical protein